MAVTDDDRLAERIRSFRNHGIQVMGSHHDFIAAGFNYRLNELEATLGISQMDEIQKIIDERQRLAESYTNLLKSIPGVSFQQTLPGATAVWQAFVIRCQKGDLGSVVERLRKFGIEANIGTYALHLLQFYRGKYHYQPSDFPNAATLYSRNMSLPFYNGMSREGIEQVVETLREVRDED